MDPTLERKQSLKNPSEQLGEIKVSQLTVPTNSNSSAISYCALQSGALKSTQASCCSAKSTLTAAPLTCLQVSCKHTDPLSRQPALEAAGG